MAKLYTKTGDKGSSGLFGGQRVPKNHARLEAYGSLDELNAQLGLVISQAANSTTEIQQLVANIERVQQYVFCLGSHLASPYEPGNPPVALPPLDDNEITWLEAQIDEHSNITPELKQFILPGGHIVASQLHVARTICRRAERVLITLHQQEPVEDHIIRYLNRLSDALFALARRVNMTADKPDIHWQPNS